MQTIKKINQKLHTLKYPLHFVTYAVTYLCQGGIISATGPLVPYLTHLTGIPQAGYSFLFVCRAFGFIAGAFFIKIIGQKYKFHKILCISNICMLGLTFLFSIIINPTCQGILLFFISCVGGFYEVLINTMVPITQKNGNVEFWMTITHAIFGIGGLIGPILVYFFQQYSYIVMGVVIGCTSISYMALKSPEDDQQISSNSLQTQANLIQKPNQPDRIITNQIQYTLCFMFFMYIGLSIIINTWISTFAVLSKCANKQQATRFSSIYWLTITISRLGMSFVDIPLVEKLSYLVKGLVMFCSISILLVWIQLPLIACYYTSVTCGITLSSIFPILFSIPALYKMKITSSQSSSFIICGSLGEGILSTLTGYLMDWFTIDMFFYSLLTLSISIGITVPILRGFCQNSVNSKIDRYKEMQNFNLKAIQNSFNQLQQKN